MNTNGLPGPVPGPDFATTDPRTAPGTWKADAICDYLLQALEDLGEMETKRGQEVYEALARTVDLIYGAQ